MRRHGCISLTLFLLFICFFIPSNATPDVEGRDKLLTTASKSQRFQRQDTSAGGATLINVTMLSSNLIANSPASSVIVYVYVTSSSQPSGYVNVTMPSGVVGLKATVSYTSLSSVWQGIASLPLNYYMPEGTYIVSGVYVGNSAGSWWFTTGVPFSVTTSFPGSSYGVVQLCAGGNVGYTSFTPKPGINATGLQCCDPTLQCSLSGTAGQLFGVSNLTVNSPQLSISGLLVTITAGLTFSGVQTISLSSGATILIATGATVTQTDTSTLTVSGCSSVPGYVLSAGSSMSPKGPSITMATNFSQNGYFIVPPNATLPLPCQFTMGSPSAQVYLSSGAQMLLASYGECRAGSITGPGQLVVQSGTFASVGCQISTSSLTITGSSSTTKFAHQASTNAVFCGQWPSTTLSGGSSVTIPMCSDKCICTQAQLLPRVALINGMLNQLSPSTIVFDMSSGQLASNGCLDISGSFVSQGNLQVLLGADPGADTLSKTLCLIRYATSPSGGCDPGILSRTTWSNAPSSYTVNATCTPVAGTLTYMIALQLTWNGDVVAYPRQSLNTSLAWALVGIALCLLASICSVVTWKIARRPAATTRSGLFEDHDANVGPVLQEADPFIPPLTQPVKPS